MNPIFNHGPSPQNRLIVVLLLSGVLIFFDHSMGSFDTVRGYLQSLVSPLQYLANTPKQLMGWLSENITTRQRLMQENADYKKQQVALRAQLLELNIVKQENERLRSLLASPVQSDIKRMVTEIISVDSDPFSHQIVINRGANDKVYEGQPVIDDNGVVGQVLHVGTTSSRVLLLTDLTHAIPVRVKRNGIRLVAAGTGRIDRLVLNHVPHSADIKVGDILVSSGLGGTFPEGYPVAKVLTVAQDESRPFARVLTEPVANLDRIRYLLLLWPTNAPVADNNKQGQE